MKILKYSLIGLFVFSILDGQEIKKDGKTLKSFTYDEALEMLKARDAQWERDKSNEELIKTLQPKWYENQYLWLGIGFILGKI